MLKVLTGNSIWGILDNKRPYNVIIALAQMLMLETTGNIVDFLSNGFKLRDMVQLSNSSASYIYMAFAEAPFKYANAR